MVNVFVENPRNGKDISVSCMETSLTIKQGRGWMIKQVALQSFQNPKQVWPFILIIKIPQTTPVTIDGIAVGQHVVKLMGVYRPQEKG